MSAMMLRSSRLVAVRAAAAVVSRAAVALRAPVARFSAESDDAFKPKSKVKADDPKAFAEKMDRVVKSNPVTLFMKGTPQQPMCGFSAQVVRILNQHGVDIHGVNVLENPDVRQGMKDYSNWPTFPQLYVNGEFIGGCDIVTQMHQSGELKTALEATKGQKTAAA